MEPGFLDVCLATRGNVVATYLALASGLPGVTSEVSPNYTLVKGRWPLSFCRFAAGFRGLDPDAAAGLAGVAKAVGGLWAFVMPGDEPPHAEVALREAGFQWRHRLANLYGVGPGQFSEEFVVADDTPTKLAVGRFMAEQFFDDTAGIGQDMLARATAESGLGIYWSSNSIGIQAAMLLSESNGAVGLYNLCVHRRLRFRGFGRQVLHHAMAVARSQGKPLVLQCKESLVPWYVKSGFIQSGEMHAYFHTGHGPK